MDHYLYHELEEESKDFKYRCYMGVMDIEKCFIKARHKYRIDLHVMVDK